MSSFEEHCWESIALFGESYAEVHTWLDAFMGTPKYGMRHRRARHHEEGIKIVARMFGEKAAQAARQHIISDLRLDGWKEGDGFPRDEEDFGRIGFF